MNTYSHLLPSIKPKSYIEEQMKKLRDGGIPDGLRTGISCLDDMVRLEFGTLAIFTGYSGMGKSEFIDWLCYRYNVRYGHKILCYSPENSTQLHLPKLISKYTGKSYNTLTPDERDKALSYVCDNFFFFDTTQEKYIEDVIQESEKYIKEYGTRILVFEPYNSFVTKKGDGNLFELNTIRLILTELRNLAIRNNVLVILSAHPKKPTDYKVPHSYDIAHSADFINRADYILTVHRRSEEVRIGAEKLRDKNYGKGGDCALSYDMASGNYYECDEFIDIEYVHDSIMLPELSEKKDVLDVEVSFYDHTKDVASSKTINLKEFLTSGKYKEIVEFVRDAQTAEERHNRKLENIAMIPCVTVSGVFSYHDTKHLTSYSGLMAIDIDGKDNSIEVIRTVPAILKEMDFISYVGKSITGDGYCAICRIENPKHFQQHFEAMKEILSAKGIVIDDHCSDVTRYRLASFDENYYYNPKATTFYYEKDIRAVRKTRTKTSTYVSYDEKELQKELEYMKSHKLTVADDYGDWFNLGMSLSTLGEEKGRYYFHQFSALSEMYDEAECDEQYNEIISHYEDNNDLTLATAIYLIKEAKENITKLNT